MNASAPSSAIRFEPLPDSAYFFAVSPQRACLAQWKSWFLMSALITPLYCVFAAATNQMWFVLIALTLPLEAMICQWILSSFQVLCVSSEGLELRCLGRVKRSMGWDEIVRVRRVTGDSSTLLLLNDTDLCSCLVAHSRVQHPETWSKDHGDLTGRLTKSRGIHRRRPAPGAGGEPIAEIFG
jgi:hypothetical protein